MIADLGFIIACSAFMMSAILMLVYKNIFHEQRKAMEKVWSSVYYLETALSYHDMLPLPWEMEDLPERWADAPCTEGEKIRNLKRDGNVVFLDENE